MVTGTLKEGAFAPVVLNGKDVVANPKEFELPMSCCVL